ncbi:hypothetical protein ANCCEY_15272, partial [Ancylostoma ceylanicum]
VLKQCFVVCPVVHVNEVDTNDSAHIPQLQYTGDFFCRLHLKGVGPYTAAAIASFAFKEVKALVDGNVYRVLARYFDISTPIDSTTGKKEFQLIADSLIPKDAPDEHNQAIMEFGSQQCVPVNPDCSACVLNNNCLAFFNNTVSERPVKEKKTKVRTQEVKHILSHQRIVTRFLHFPEIPNNLQQLSVDLAELENIPLPRLIDRYLETS